MNNEPTPDAFLLPAAAFHLRFERECNAMNDQPTPEEIKQFEKDNPQLAPPKEISPNWITAGNLALIAAVVWMWVWVKKNIFRKGGD